MQCHASSVYLPVVGGVWVGGGVLHQQPQGGLVAVGGSVVHQGGAWENTEGFFHIENSNVIYSLTC